MHSVRSGMALVALLWTGLVIIGVVSGTVRSGVNLAVNTTRATSESPAQPSSSTQAWTFQVDEATLSQDLNTWAAGQPLLETPLGKARLHQLTVQLRDNLVVMHGIADAGWFTEPVALSASATADAGRALLRVHEARVGGVDLPDAVRSELEQQLQNRLDVSAQANRVVVQSVSVGDGTLVINGSRL